MMSAEGVPISLFIHSDYIFRLWFGWYFKSQFHLYIKTAFRETSFHLSSVQISNMEIEMAIVFAHILN